MILIYRNSILGSFKKKKFQKKVEIFGSSSKEFSERFYAYFYQNFEFFEKKLLENEAHVLFDKLKWFINWDGNSHYGMEQI